MIRLFVALDLPADVRERLSGLGGGVPGALWVDQQNFHLTLRFIGDVDDDVAEDIAAALAEVTAPAFDLVLDGVCVFATGRRPNVLWVGVEKTPALVHLRDKVESALVRLGMPPEDRKFAPHVTLARLRDAPPARVARFIEERGLFRAGPIPIDSFALYASLRGSGGPVYRMLADYPLTDLARSEGSIRSQRLP